MKNYFCNCGEGFDDPEERLVHASTCPRHNLAAKLPEDKQPTPEQVKEVWEECDFKYEEHGTRFEHWWSWESPDKEYRGCGNPPLDLNNLFRYAIPLLEDILGYAEYYKLLLRWINIFTKNNSDPALALFWVIQPEVIHES